eukprot:PhM_4_TR13627/c2_g1_i1/m.63871
MRAITTPSQYRPLHTFKMDRRYVAKTLEEFKTVITNPGAVKVNYSKDYLDWYWAAYQTKVRNHEAALKVAEQPPLLYEMPRTSRRRKDEERVKKVAQATMDKCAHEHALMDLWERRPQYPAVDLRGA